MMHGKARKIFIQGCLILLIGSVSGNMNAQAQETNLITGKMYAMYFLTVSGSNNTRGLSQMDFMFNEDSSVSVMDLQGHGSYAAFPGSFVATYFADNAFMNFEMMDIFVAMTGISIDPFITGVGFFLIDYVNIIPFVFTGRQVAE